MKHVLVQERLIWEALHQDATSEFDALWEVLQSCEVQGYVTEQDLSSLYQRIAQEQGVGSAFQLVTQFRRVLKVYSAEADGALDAAIAHADGSQLPEPSDDLPVLSVASFLERYVLYQLYQADEPGMPQGGWYRRWRASGFDPMLLWPVALVLVLQELPLFQQMLLSSGLDAGDGGALNVRMRDRVAIATAPSIHPLSPSDSPSQYLPPGADGAAQAAESGEGGRSPHRDRPLAEGQLGTELAALTDAPLMAQERINIPPPDLHSRAYTNASGPMKPGGSLSPSPVPSSDSPPPSAAADPPPAPPPPIPPIPLRTQPNPSAASFSVASVNDDAVRSAMLQEYHSATNSMTGTVTEAEVSSADSGAPPSGRTPADPPPRSPEDGAVTPETPAPPRPPGGDRPPPHPVPPETVSPDDEPLERSPADPLLGSPAFVIHADPTSAPSNDASSDDNLLHRGTQGPGEPPPLSFYSPLPWPPNPAESDGIPAKDWHAMVYGEGSDRPPQQSLLQGQSPPSNSSLLSAQGLHHPQSPTLVPPAPGGSVRDGLS